MSWHVTTAEALIAVAAFAAGVVVSSIVVGAFLVLIPANHFLATDRGLSRRLRSAPARLALAIGKNTLGVLLVIVGIALSLPGIPGQGLLTILVGVMLLDVPAKRRFELGLVRRPRVRRAIDRLRQRFGREPLRLDDEQEGPPHPSVADDHRDQ